MQDFTLLADGVKVMIIKLFPQQRPDTLRVSKRSDVLTINGDRFDFRPVVEGATLPRAAIDCEFIVGDIVRKDGQLIIPLLLPYAVGASDDALFAKDIIDPPDGNLELPI